MKLARNLLLLLLTLSPALAADTSLLQERSATAARFIQYVLAADEQAYSPLVTPRLRKALSVDGEQLRETLAENLGELKDLGEARLEKEDGDKLHLRFPARFSRGQVDLQVIFDGGGHISGFFQAPAAKPMAAAAKPGPSQSANLSRQDIASQFIRDVLGANQAGIALVATERLQNALSIDGDQLRQTVGENLGILVELGDPSVQEQEGGGEELRIPATFTEGKVDLRVVFDKDGRISGFFQAPGTAAE